MQVCVCVCTHASFAQSCLTFWTPWTIACQAPLSMDFSRQEYWSGLPLTTPEDLSNPGIETTSLRSPALAGRFFTAAPPGKPPENKLTRYQRGKGRGIN